MPSLGADMEAGTLVEWRVSAGDRVKRGDVVAVVDTQKAAIEVEIYETGIIDALLVEPGTRVPVGTVLATVRKEEARSVEGARERAPLPEGKERKGAPPPEAEAPPPVAPLPEAKARPEAAPKTRARPRISPAARRRARELEVDPSTLAGTGPHGSVVVRDVEEADGRAAERPPKPPPERAAPPAAPPSSERLAGLRQAIAAAMTRSNREIPHYYLSTTIDLAPAMEFLAEENTRRPIEERLLLGVLLLKATALALREVPELNGYWTDGALDRREEIHVGNAVSLRGGGVITPALHDVDRKSVSTLMPELRDLVQRARAGSLRSSELSDATVTVTSLGERGPDEVYGVIYPPQVALVGFGGVLRRPWAVGDALAVRPVVKATLAADHRATDGHRGGLFLKALERRLGVPEKL